MVVMGRNAWAGFLAGVVLAAVGCGGSEEGAGGTSSCIPAAAIPCPCADGSSGTQVCNLDGMSYGACACGLGNQGLGSTEAGTLSTGSTAGTSGSMSSGGGSGTPLPCDVQEILVTHCQTCHSDPTKFTAPMPLVSWEDLTKPSLVDPTVPNYQRVLARVMDTQKPMPQPPNAPLSVDQIAVLQNWVNGGAVAGTTTSCGGGEAGTGGAAGTGAAGTGSVDPEEECFEFLAHADGDKSQPFPVPTTPDTYRLFNFAPPWGTDEVQAIRSETVIDNSSVIHHWILYSSSGAVTDGSVTSSSGAHPGGQFVVGWAPGSPSLDLPADVGLEVPGAGYQLEVHYNAKSAGQTDASGVKLCVTRNKRTNTAATHPLGKEVFATFNAGNVTGECKPRGPFPITILTSSPHMHLKGTHMKTVIKRAGGGEEMLVDKAFDFNNQLVYDTPATINEGDILVTTCTYNGAVTYGTGTSQEMCYNFVTAYPAGALSGASGYTGVSGNGNTCIK
jgi:Copper type II ascorbate-dependent monooxygenase, C-terminal domain/Copper type II ascorbate-dependent monooxygenase, N-terminal domain